MLIMSKGEKSVQSLQQWARERKATELFISHAPLYIDYCNKLGVNYEVAYCQYAKETHYGKFDGVVNISFNNPCGLKIPEGGPCDKPNSHKQFNNWEEGIKAHIDHLALYAGAAGFPKYSKEVPYKGDDLKNLDKYKANGISGDPRHFTFLYGKCKTVESLGGNWAPNPNYGNDIVTMVNQIIEIKKDDSLKINFSKKIKNVKTNGSEIEIIFE